MSLKNLYNLLVQLFKKPFHPLIFSLFPILYLYSRNTNYLPINVIVVPVIGCLAFVCLLFWGIFFLLHEVNKSALVTSLLVGIIVSYQFFNKFVSQFSHELSAVRLGLDQFIFIFWGLVLFFFLRWVFKSKKQFKVLTQALNAAALVLFLTPLSQTVVSEARTFQISLSNNEVKVMLDKSQSKKTVDKPDIYYFIFDRYGGENTIENFYKFDNSGFYNFLSDQGFYLANKSTSNYPRTFLSLASSLNLSYLNFTEKKIPQSSSADEKLANHLIEDNEVQRYLKEKGYKFYNVGSWWPVTRTNYNADKNYLPTSFGLNIDEFYRTLVQQTILVPIIRSISPIGAASLFHFENHRGTILSEFGEFKGIVDKGNPKFVFTHILMPHDPFVFDKSCAPISEGGSKSEVALYVGQLQCANQKIEALVKQLLKDKNNKPIIILQADEGPHPILNQRGADWEHASLASLNEKFPILNAYYFPDQDYSTLYKTITPVNSFRVVFNKYFTTGLRLLPDRNYIYPNDDHEFTYIDVTSRLIFNK